MLSIVKEIGDLPFFLSRTYPSVISISILNFAYSLLEQLDR